MHFGISVPTHGDYADARVLAEMAREAEDAGWEGFFVWDHLNDVDGPLADPWVALSAIAMRTRRIRLGPMLTPLPRRRPWKVARETATLDRLSDGRLVLGVGLGYPRDEEFEAFGEDGDERVRAGKLDESLDILRGLWTGEPFEYSGEHFTVRPTTFLPRPVQEPGIPVWVGGYWPNRAPFRRAARWDGVYPGRLTKERRAKWTPRLWPLEDVREMVAYVAAHRVRPEPADVVIGGYTAGTDRNADADVTAPYAEAGVTWWVENLHSFRGSFEDMRARLRLGPPVR
ncbi:LLM class flavin-dependent oxidoreductase [Amycolatopsis samaneae]|uniref:LLM class flavin-dependent oxidoreductase n=1 Tax=Amycolatopsis samaneae TaxID=664691 RepID=A0ABW5GFR1_9PSEU